MLLENALLRQRNTMTCKCQRLELARAARTRRIALLNAFAVPGADEILLRGLVNIIFVDGDTVT